MTACSALVAGDGLRISQEIGVTIWGELSEESGSLSLCVVQ